MPKALILASQSPRRKELLTNIGATFTVAAPKFTEIQPENHTAHELVRLNAQGKARSLVQDYPKAIIIGVDTVGSYQDQVLEKPTDTQDAARMLRMLSGTTHQVLSGLCIIDTESGQERSAIEETDIEFLPLTDAEIQAYIASGEPMDKAAAYAAQGIASLFVKRFSGDFFNVVGLPMARLNTLLKEFDINLLNTVK